MSKILKTRFYCKRDDLNICGYEYRPQGNNLPIAVVSHGFMANMLTVKHYAKTLAELGYCAFIFDFCGGCVMLGKSDGKTTEMSVLTEVKDLCAVIEYAKKLEYTDESNIVLMGCSQGGFVSSLTASLITEEVSKLVLFYPAFCIPDDARSGNMMWAKFDPNNVPKIVKCGPMKLGKRYVEDVLHMDPYEEIKKYNGDVLIVHGTNDSIVNMKYIEQAFDTYSKRNTKKDVILKIISGGKHMFSKKHDKIAVKYLKEFLNKNQ